MLFLTCVAFGSMSVVATVELTLQALFLACPCLTPETAWMCPPLFQCADFYSKHAGENLQ